MLHLTVTRTVIMELIRLPQLKKLPAFHLSCRQHMPDPVPSLHVPVMCYEQLLDDVAAELHTHGFSWPKLDENSPAGLCYTSGTTGNPKVLLSTI